MIIRAYERETLSDWPIRQEPPPEPQPLKALAVLGIMLLGWAAVNWLVLGKHERIPPM